MLGLLIAFLPQSPERTVGLIVTGMVICEVFSAVSLVILFRLKMGRRPHPDGPAVSWKRIASIAVPVGFTALLGNLMASANSVLIPQKLVAGGMEVSDAMSAFGVLCGMTVPLLNMPTALIGAMCLIMVPKLAESAALGDRRTIPAAVGPGAAGHLGADDARHRPAGGGRPHAGAASLRRPPGGRIYAPPGGGRAAVLLPVGAVLRPERRGAAERRRPKLYSVRRRTAAVHLVHRRHIPAWVCGAMWPGFWSARCWACC